jgi:hypothetical protein
MGNILSRIKGLRDILTFSRFHREQSCRPQSRPVEDKRWKEITVRKIIRQSLSLPQTSVYLVICCDSGVMN